MIRRRYTWFLGVISTILLLFLLSPFLAKANVNNFVITDYSMEFELDRDNEERSVLKTTETITAEFPEHDQNRGIERAIPATYQGHPVGLRIQSVKDELGKDLEYTTYNDGSKNTVVRIGNANTFVHGEQTYVLTYTQRDVTDYFENTNSDEFYWDTNGTDWRVPIKNLSVTLKISDDLTPLLSGKTDCYVGYLGSNTTCDFAQNGSIFTTSASDLGLGENITIAVGFHPGTFAPYEQTFLESLTFWWLFIQSFAVPISFMLFIWIIISISRVANRTREQVAIVPEYLPPPNTSVSVSANVISSSFTFTAQLIDLAVRRYLRIVEISPKKTFSPAQYEVEILKPTEDLRPEERLFLEGLFNDQVLEVGSRFALKNLRSASVRLASNRIQILKLVRETYALRTKSKEGLRGVKKITTTTFIFSALFLSPTLFITALVTNLISRHTLVLTDKGLSLVRYLKGLRMYIKVAETRRLQILQSPEGALKTQIDTSDPRQVINLYEKVLPYAVLFGLEKQWAKELERYYEAAGTEPTWFVGTSGAAFSASSFSSSLSSFSASTSSSGGGSGGGGSSGGGGGGGGGGGW